MKDRLPDYLEASILTQELLHRLLSLGTPHVVGSLPPLSEWVASSGNMFREAFLKIVPEVSFYCRDYSVPMQDAYCKFTLCSEDQMTTDVYCGDTSFGFTGGSGSFFLFLDLALKQPARVEKLPETEFFRIILEISRSMQKCIG